MTNLQDSIIKKIPLNPQQKKVVHATKGPILVIAGAGSGKTRVITARIAYLISSLQVWPSAIIGLTFTNKAAHEMKERINQFLDDVHEQPFIGTFHSFCLKLLKKYTKNSFTILDEEDKLKLLNKIIRENGLHKQLSSRQAAYYISQLKNSDPFLKNRFEKAKSHPLLP